jgi:2-polyprenyl-3-methyl-5-hydroxy-6-metoxy-1,4-benzoquinol methylase
MYTDPQPPAEAWEILYPDDYPPHQVKASEGEGHGSRLLSPRKRLALQLAPALSRWIDPYLVPLKRRDDGAPGKLLDVGCGSGKYLARMKSLGWDVLGIDYSERAAQTAQSAYGVDVRVGTVPNKELPVAAFDLVTAWQVLEHLQRPRQALAGIRSLLKPDGVFILSVPNQAGWAARYFGPDWIGLDVPRHLSHFTPASLLAMLRSEGFHVQHLSTICQSGWIRQSARTALQTRKGRRLRWLTSHTVSSMVSRWAQRSNQAESIYAIASVAKAQPVGKKLDRQL